MRKAAQLFLLGATLIAGAATQAAEVACPGPLIPHDCENAKCACSPLAFGDPVALLPRAVFHRTKELELRTSTGVLEFFTTYVSTPATWTNYYTQFQNLPPPFGAPTADSPLWLHNWYSYVRLKASPALTMLYTPGGAAHEFSPTVGAGGYVNRSVNSPGIPERLKVIDGGYEWISADGEIKRYQAKWNDAVYSQTAYFLTSGISPNGTPRFTVEYASVVAPISDGGTFPCPEGASGSTPGAPWVYRVVSSDGQAWRFFYGARPRPGGGPLECSLSSVRRETTGGVVDGVAFSYVGSPETSGLLSGVDGGLISESFQYQTSGSNNLFLAVRPNDSTSYQVESAGGKAISSDFGQTVSAGFVGTSYTFSDAWGSNLTCAAPSSVLTTIQSSNVTVGDGTDAGVTYSLVSNVSPMYGTARHSGEARSQAVSCSPSSACSAGTTTFAWGAGDAGSPLTCDQTTPGYQQGVQDRRGNWAVTEKRLNGAFGGNWEVTRDVQGASTLANAVGLESSSYTYDYTTAGLQRRTSSVSKSTLDSATNAITYYVYDSDSSRLAAEIRSGLTLATGSSTPVAKYVATFYRTTRTCSAGGADPLGRTLSIEGPCFVSSTSATTCLNSAHPITDFTYFGAGSTIENAGRLASVSRFPNGCGAALTTSFADYTFEGDPKTVTEPNGVTSFTYRSGTHLVETRSVGGKTWTYAYDKAGHLISTAFPGGGFEVNCYRSGANNDCTTGILTNQVWRRSRSGSISGSPWNERISYDYWRDGSLMKMSFEACNTPSGCTTDGEVRRVQKFAQDAEARPTFEGWGEAPGPAGVKYALPKAFDAAGNVSKLGRTFQVAGAFCQTNPYACSSIAWDDANRLSSVDGYPNPAPATNAIRTCVNYDSAGNVRQVASGCLQTDLCTGCTRGDQCGQSLAACDNSSSLYQSDDFGNLVRVQTGNTQDSAVRANRGTYEYEYDVLGGVIKRRTPTSVTQSATHLYLYDQLGRQTEHDWLVSGQSPVMLSKQVWDSVTPPSGCSTPQNTAGRLSATIDPRGETLFSYDTEGRLLAETFSRSTTTCSGTDAVLQTSYTYSGATGLLTEIAYPHGRRVVYQYGTGGLWDRVSGIVTNTYGASGWSNPPATVVVSNVRWEPFGGIRSYLNRLQNGTDQTVEYYLGDDGAVIPSGETPTAPPSGTSDKTGLVRALFVSEGGTPGNVYRRWFTWKGDHIAHEATSVRNSAAQVEDYGAASPNGYPGYDGVDRFVSMYNGTFTTTGGVGYARYYSYNQRGNATMTYVDPYGNGMASTYDTAPREDRLLKFERSAASGIGRQYTYDLAGRVSSILGKNDSIGPSLTYTTSFDQQSDAGVSADTDGVLRSVMVNGAAYNYFYDVQNRRRLKVMNTSATEEYFYDQGHQLLEDRGSAQPTPGAFEVDEYVWLGGRPVAVWRGAISSSWVRAADSSTGDCTRSGDASKCGLYFLVHDYLPKPVLTLAWDGKVVGTGEYDPYGEVNRIQHWGESAHPYGNNENYSLAQITAPTIGLALDVRGYFSLFDTEPYCNSGNYDSVWMYSGPWATQTLTTPYFNNRTTGHGAFWTGWFTPAGGVFGAGWYSNGDHKEYPFSCLAAGAGGHSGAAFSGYQLRRYESGKSPWWPPIRFPGQYYDGETGLHENWNRFYDPQTGRYLSPEPLGRDPRYVRWMVMNGSQVPAYAYAANNPLNRVDPNGNQVAETATAVTAAAAITAVVAAAAIWCAYHPQDCIEAFKRTPFSSPWPRFEPPGGNPNVQPMRGARPSGCPTGTKPIDQSGLDHDTIEGIKRGIGSGPRDWTGISPDGHVWGPGEDGKTGQDHGHWTDYVPGQGGE